MIPPEESTDFVFHMENVLSLYQEQYDPDRPVVCFDEHPTQLVEQVREPQSASPGQVEREDYHFKPAGTKNLFLASEPLDGWRAISVTDRRTTEDWVNFMQELVEEHYPDVESLRVVLDNLNTHDPAAFYDYLPPAEARRLLDTLEFHFTPVHGSWLNMAEIEFNRLKGQCLDRRIPDGETLKQEVFAWTEARNGDESDVNWQFTSEDARTKLRRLYPTL